MNSNWFARECSSCKPELTVSALTDPLGEMGTVAGVLGTNLENLHGSSANLTQFDLDIETTGVRVEADFMTNWSGNPQETDSLLHLFEVNDTDRVLLLGINDGRLMTYFTEPNTPSDNRLKLVPPEELQQNTWYTIRADLTREEFGTRGRMFDTVRAWWKLAGEPNSAFAPSANADVTSRIFNIPRGFNHNATGPFGVHMLMRDRKGDDDTTGVFMDNIFVGEIGQVRIPEPSSFMLTSLGLVAMMTRLGRRRNASLRR